MAGSDDSAKVSSDAGQKVIDALRSMIAGRDKVGLGVRITTNAIGAMIATMTSVVMGFFGAVFRVASETIAVFLAAVAGVRTDNQDAINLVIANGLSEVLGIDISSSDLPTGGTTAGRIQLFKSIGAKVLDSLKQEFSTGPNATAGAGEAAAETFLGFGLNFATSASVLAVVTEMASLGFLKEFAQFGEEMSRALGLSRLMRQALHPLINAAITLPYTREMNARYRPHLLAVAEYATALNAGRISADQFNTVLGELGFSDDLITEITAQHAHRLHLHEIDLLVRWGQLDATAGVDMLVASGIPRDNAQLMFTSLHLQMAETQERAYAAEILKQAQGGFLDSETFSTLLQRLHLPQEEQQGFLNRLGEYLEVPHRRLSIAEIIYLQERNLLTNDVVLQWATSEGYSPTDAESLDLYVTSKELEYQAAQKAKADKAKAKAAAAGAKAAAVAAKGAAQPPTGG